MKEGKTTLEEKWNSKNPTYYFYSFCQNEDKEMGTVEPGIYVIFFLGGFGTGFLFCRFLGLLYDYLERRQKDR